MWKRIIEKMYDPKDFEILEMRINQLIVGNKKGHLEQSSKKFTREELQS
jgi:hypothetical protein